MKICVCIEIMCVRHTSQKKVNLGQLTTYTLVYEVDKGWIFLLRIIRESEKVKVEREKQSNPL